MSNQFFDGTLFDEPAPETVVMAVAKKKKKPDSGSCLEDILPKPTHLRKLPAKRVRSRYKPRSERQIVDKPMDLIMEFRSLIRDMHPVCVFPSSYMAESNFAVQVLDALQDYDRLDASCCRLWLSMYIRRYLTAELAAAGKKVSLRDLLKTRDEFVPLLPQPEKTCQG